jgi:hypothetical protein
MIARSDTPAATPRTTGVARARIERLTTQGASSQRRMDHTSAGVPICRTAFLKAKRSRCIECAGIAATTQRLDPSIERLRHNREGVSVRRASMVSMAQRLRDGGCRSYRGRFSTPQVPVIELKRSCILCVVSVQLVWQADVRVQLCCHWSACLTSSFKRRDLWDPQTVHAHFRMFMPSLHAVRAR